MLREEKQSRENLAEETRRDVNDIEQRISRLLETEMDVFFLSLSNLLKFLLIIGQKRKWSKN